MCTVLKYLDWIWEEGGLLCWLVNQNTSAIDAVAFIECEGVFWARHQRASQKTYSKYVSAITQSPKSFLIYLFAIQCYKNFLLLLASFYIV